MSARILSMHGSYAVSRRSFLFSTSAAAAVAGLSQVDFLSGLPRVSAEEAKPDPKMVRFNDEIEPLVRLVEETPREKLLEEAEKN